MFWKEISSEIFFFILQKMPNTKFTKAKSCSKCPLCDGEVLDNRWREHLLKCNGGKFPWKTCGKLYKKSSYLQRHEKKFHGKDEVPEKERDADKEWLEQDPGDLNGEISNDSSSGGSSSDSEEEVTAQQIQGRLPPASQVEKIKGNKDEENNCSILEEGRTVRKPTAPIPVFAPQRKTTLSMPEKDVSVNRFKFKSFSSTSTQTEVADSSLRNLVKRRKLRKTTSSYIKDDKKVEEVVEEEKFFYDEWLIIDIKKGVANST